MKFKWFNLYLLGISFSLTSCNDYLDMTPTDSVSDKMVWSSTQNAEYAVNYLYKSFYQLSNFTLGQCAAGMTEGLTDVLKYGSSNYNALQYIPSEIAYGGTTLTVNYVSVYLGNWDTMYDYIRRTNENLYNLHRYGTISENDATRLEAEMRFIRAFLYFDLIKRYKEVIIYDDDLTKMTKDKALSTESEAWDFVEADLKYAAEKLPMKANANGRLDKGAAYAFMTRAMLYAERWEAVRTAANEVKKLGYGLETNYADSYSKTIKDGNKEAILQYCFDQSKFSVGHDFDSYYAPGGDKALDGNTVVGGFGTPTQEMVESYELATGGFPDWTAWHTTEGTTNQPPYVNLEPRFQATILYNGASWKGRIVEPYVKGTDGWATWMVDAKPEGRTTTGYYLRKLVDEGHSFKTTQVSTQPWTVIRYAEVLLNNAEACYRLNDATNANISIKEIRSRVGLPYQDKDGTELWKAIKQERKVELAYEGQWYWDLRRWKLASQSYDNGGLNNYRVHGVKIEKSGDNFIYTYVECDTQDRNYPSKMYRFPIPQTELNNNALVEQSQEWK